jgi:hypothetical protein
MNTERIYWAHRNIANLVILKHEKDKGQSILDQNRIQSESAMSILKKNNHPTYFAYNSLHNQIWQ